MDMHRLTRRETLQWMVAASATVSLLDAQALAQQAGTPIDAAIPGIGTDPNLVNPLVPWKRTMTESQLAIAAALCDVILPADDQSPAASAVGVHEFIDEWISAPYDAQQRDRKIILEGLEWLEADAQKKFQRAFVSLAELQKRTICDPIASLEKAQPTERSAAVFFAKMRNLACGAFYTTPEGMKDVGYVGNVPLPTFEGPPAEVLRRLGLDDV